METRFSCLIKGAIAVIFGLLALLAPEWTLGFFSVAFRALLVLGIVVCIFLAITGSSNESMLWFGLAAGMILVGAVTFFIENTISLIVILIFAGIAFYSAFTDITFALTQPKTKYFLIAGMLLAGLILLGLIIKFVPALTGNPMMMVIGVAAFVFGISSILMGWYLADATPGRAAAAPVKK